MSTTLSVVMPVHDEAAHLGDTIAALAVAAGRASFATDLVLVDDGSSDESADVALRAAEGRLPLRIVSQPGRGRFLARKAGIEAAGGEYVLLLDGRVRLRPPALAFVHGRIAAGETVWNGHVHVETDGNPYGTFSNLLAELAWREYFDDPRTTSFDAESFDRYPKGTGCFVAPRALLLDALGAFRLRYPDPRAVNDDTSLIRWISSRVRIHLSPDFACDYAPRSSFRSFVRHSVHRGTVFLDGHGRRESRFFPVVAAFFPVSAAAALASLRRPSLVPALGLATAAAGAAVVVRARRSPGEAVAFGALLPLYAVAHGAGMWRGLVLLARGRRAPAAG